MVCKGALQANGGTAMPYVPMQCDVALELIGRDTVLKVIEVANYKTRWFTLNIVTACSLQRLTEILGWDYFLFSCQNDKHSCLKKKIKNNEYSLT